VRIFHQVNVEFQEGHLGPKAKVVRGANGVMTENGALATSVMQVKQAFIPKIL